MAHVLILHISARSAVLALLPLLVVIWLRLHLIWVIVLETAFFICLLIAALVFLALSKSKSPKIQTSLYRPPKLTFLQETAWKNELASLGVKPESLSASSVQSSDLVAERISTFLNFIMSEFIESWCYRISPHPWFRDSIMAELTQVTRRLENLLTRVDLSELLIVRILPIVDRHLKKFAHLRLTKSFSLLSMESKLEFAKKLNLHKAVSLSTKSKDKHTEKNHLRKLMQRMLPHLLSPEEASSELATQLVQEILACTVLSNVLNAISESDFINLMIVKFIGENLQRRERVKRLREALKEHTLQRDKKSKISFLDKSGKLSPKAYARCIDLINDSPASSTIESMKADLELRRQADITQEELGRIDDLLIAISDQQKNRDLQLPNIVDSLYDDRFFDSLIDALGPDEVTKRKILLWRAIDSIKAPLEDDDAMNVTLHLKYADLGELQQIYDQFLKDSSEESEFEAKTHVEEYLNNASSEDDRLYNIARFSLFELQKVILDDLNRIDLTEFLLQKKSRSTLSRNNRLMKEPSIAFLPRLPSKDDNAEQSMSPAVIEAVGNAFDQIMSNTPTQASYSIPFQHRNDSQESNFNLAGEASSLFGETLSDFPQDNSGFLDDSSEAASLANSVDSEQILNNSDSNQDLSGLEILRAAPGDLSLSEEIARISKEIDSLLEQDSIVTSLLKKAELTNNVTELRVLRKSKLSLEREIRSKELQKQQYIVQESENTLFGKSRVQIQSYVLAGERTSRFVMYIIEVQKFSSEDTSQITAGWVVARRFSQFCQLHDYLKRIYPNARNIKLPKKSMPMLKSQKKQLPKERRKALEKYLQDMLTIPEVCSDAIFRSFLSSETFLFRPSKSMKKLSVDSKSATYNVENQHLLENMKEMQKELKEFDEWQKKSTSKGSFVKPISEFLMDAFDLQNSSNWIRGRAFLVILQQVLGSAIEKSIRGSVQSLLGTESRIVDLLDALTGALFPNGKFREPPEVRGKSQQNITRKEARAMLGMFMDDMCSRLFGTANTRMAYTNIFEMFQNDYVNKSILLEVLDEIIHTVFQNN